jgi:hypothetical protein
MQQVFGPETKVGDPVYSIYKNALSTTLQRGVIEHLEPRLVVAMGKKYWRLSGFSNENGAADKLVPATAEMTDLFERKAARYCCNVVGHFLWEVEEETAVEIAAQIPEALRRMAGVNDYDEQSVRVWGEENDDV